MFQLIDFIKESQRHFDPFWIFTVRRPSYWQRLERKSRLFDPYLVRQDENKAKADGLKYANQTLNRRYRFLSIFFNCSIPNQRYASFRRALTEYRKWLHRQSRWYNFWYNRIRPWTAQILAGVTFYLVAQFGMFFFMWVNYHYKKRTAVYLYKFFWYNVIKKILFLGFCAGFLVTEVVFVFLFPCFLVLFYILSYVVIARSLVFIYANRTNRVFERGVLLSSPRINKYGLGKNSFAIRRFFQLNWRLAGSLNTRYVKVLERFYGNQFPYKRSEDDLFLDYLGVRSVGWLKLDFPISRVGFYFSFFPGSLIARCPRFYRWRDLPIPLRWSGFWYQRRSLKINERFYSKNIILYTKSSERLRFKTHNLFYNEFLISYIENLKIDVNSIANQDVILSPFVVKRYPWWFYREKTLAFTRIRLYLVNLFAVYKNVSPWFGDLFNIGRPRRKKRNYFYFFNYGIFVVRATRGRLLNWGTRSLRYRLDSVLYNSLWLRLRMFLVAFFWRLFLPPNLVFNKVTFVKVLLFLFAFSLLIIISPKGVLLLFKACF